MVRHNHNTKRKPCLKDRNFLNYNNGWVVVFLKWFPHFYTDCQVYAVGKPVFHRHTDAVFGSWMRDAQPRTEANLDKYWVTLEADHSALYEYANKTVYRKDIYTKKYRLEYPFLVGITCKSLQCILRWQPNHNILLLILQLIK